MTTRKSQQHSKLNHKTRNLGLSAMAAAMIGAFAFQQSATTNAAGPATSTPTATASITPSPTPSSPYHDGTYTGSSFSAERYGNVQVEAVIANGQLINFNILDYPYHRQLSQEISQQSLPYLMQEAVTVQSASVDLVSGATFTSEAFIQSLQTALDLAAAAPTATPTLTATPTATAIVKRA